MVEAISLIVKTDEPLPQRRARTLPSVVRFLPVPSCSQPIRSLQGQHILSCGWSANLPHLSHRLCVRLPCPELLCMQ